MNPGRARVPLRLTLVIVGLLYRFRPALGSSGCPTFDIDLGQASPHQSPLSFRHNRSLAVSRTLAASVLLALCRSPRVWLVGGQWCLGEPGARPGSARDHFRGALEHASRSLRRCGPRGCEFHYLQARDTRFHPPSRADSTQIGCHSPASQHAPARRHPLC